MFLRPPRSAQSSFGVFCKYSLYFDSLLASLIVILLVREQALSLQRSGRLPLSVAQQKTDCCAS